MKFKHHLNEQNMAHFIFLWLVSGTPGLFFFSFFLRHIVYPQFTLFTDYLTIRVLNKNEVRKWFENYRSCRTCFNSNKRFCERGSNKKKKEKKNTCAFNKYPFTQLCIFGYKVGWMISQLLPHGPLRKNKGENKQGTEGGYGNTNSLWDKLQTGLILQMSCAGSR